MNKSGPIVIVEDDEDDRELIQNAFSLIDLKNEVLYFSNGVDAYEYLSTAASKPFIIISDINMPKMTGTQLRDKMQKEGELRHKTVPFLFLTTGVAANTIIQAYANSVQGFFTKESGLESFQRTIKRIVEYWSECAAPTFS